MRSGLVLEKKGGGETPNFPLVWKGGPKRCSPPKIQNKFQVRKKVRAGLGGYPQPEKRRTWGRAL